MITLTMIDLFLTLLLFGAVGYALWERKWRQIRESQLHRAETTLRKVYESRKVSDVTEKKRNEEIQEIVEVVGAVMPEGKPEFTKRMHVLDTYMKRYPGTSMREAARAVDQIMANGGAK